MSAELDQGDWYISCDDEDTPEGMIKLKFAEISSEGVKDFSAYMTPDGADEYADKIKELAQWVRENSGDD